MSEQLVTEMEAAGEAAMERLSLGSHESEAWSAVEAPMYDLLRMVREGWNRWEVRDHVEENQQFYQYAAFDAAYSVYLQASA